MKEIICVTLSLFILTCFTACGGGSGNSSGKQCQFKKNGHLVCGSKATKGDLCSYHFNMLNDIYNDFAN